MFPRGLPYFTRGIVVNGFGRGSRDLGIPTANYAEDVVEALPKWIEAGIYYGWAQIDGGPVYKMVMSIGWNPYFKNTKRAMEVHIIHHFDKTFYGSEMKVAVLKYLRPELDFESMEELIKTIKSDISTADLELSKPELQVFQSHEYFSDVLNR